MSFKFETSLIISQHFEINFKSYTIKYIVIRYIIKCQCHYYKNEVVKKELKLIWYDQKGSNSTIISLTLLLEIYQLIVRNSNILI